MTVHIRTQKITDPAPCLAGGRSRLIQRKCACGRDTGSGGECEECLKKRLSLQRKSCSSGLGSHGDSAVPSIVHEVLHSPGQPLDQETRAFFEARFAFNLGQTSSYAQESAPVPAQLGIVAPDNGLEHEAETTAQKVMSQSAKTTARGHDFSRIRIHTDQNAADSAQAINALAYTVGRDIVFAQGQYKPHTRSGAQLIAHELTHVLQRSGASSRFTTIQGNGSQLSVDRPAPPTGMIARQPQPGWSDAPEKGPNRAETTVGEKGTIVPGKVADKGVWRVPLEGLKQGFQDTDKGPADESPGGRAVVLIPNTVKPAAPDKDKNVSVDVLLHLHGFGVGSRQLRPGKQDYGGVLKEDQVRDVHLYEMEQQLLSLVDTTKKLIIAVLPQGSVKSNFGDLGSKSDAYLKEVFGKLIPRFLPENAVPGHTTVSTHSGGGPTVMQMASQRAAAGKRTDVILFDAINFSKTCESNEITTVKDWVTNRIAADIKSLDGVAEKDQPATLQTNGTRFRGITSGSLESTDKCSYGYWYGQLKKHIDEKIKNLKVTSEVRDQLSKNYQVLEAQHLESLTGMERHERMIGKGNLEDALKD
jgi:hypothetical protein